MTAKQILHCTPPPEKEKAIFRIGDHEEWTSTSPIKEVMSGRQVSWQMKIYHTTPPKVEVKPRQIHPPSPKNMVVVMPVEWYYDEQTSSKEEAMPGRMVSWEILDSSLKKRGGNT